MRKGKKSSDADFISSKFWTKENDPGTIVF